MFTPFERKYQQFEDELPPAPASNGGAEQTAAPVDGVFDPNFLFGKDIPKLGEAIPAGDYHLRLSRFKESWQDADPTDLNAVLFGKQPQFMVSWAVQQEPHTGAIVMDFVEWINKETMEQAKAGNPAARAIARERLKRARAIMEAGEYRGGDIKEFLASNPEVRGKVTLKPKNAQVDVAQPDGTTTKEWKPTGEMKNGIFQYESLRRPRS